MANIRQIQENSRRATMATNGSSFIIDKQLLKQKLQEVFYADSIKDIMKIIKPIEGQEYKEPIKKTKGSVLILTNVTIKAIENQFDKDREISFKTGRRR